MAQTRIGGAIHPPGDAVALAIIRGAKIRSAPLHADRRLVAMGIERVIGPLWVLEHGPLRRGIDAEFVGVGAIPVRAPLPDIARHVIKPVAVFGITFHRGAADVPIHRVVFIGKGAKPDIGFCGPLIGIFVTPCERLPLKSAPGREFPFGLGGKTLFRPRGIGQRIIKRDIDHRVIGFGLPGGSRTARRFPRIAGLEHPPLETIITVVDFGRRRREHPGAGNEFCGGDAWEFPGIERAFGDRFVSGRLDKAGEFGVGHLGGIHEEAIDFDLVRGAGTPAFDRVGIIAHHKFPTRDPDHLRFGSRPRCPLDRAKRGEPASDDDPERGEGFVHWSILY